MRTPLFLIMEILVELKVTVATIEHIEAICKKEGLNLNDLKKNNVFSENQKL